MRQSLVLLALLAASPLAWAGRPLSTDDAGTADVGKCQLEGWQERDRESRALVVAPACGVARGVELGADFTRPSPRDPVRAEAGLAVKWVPESWRVDTGAGELNFGLKAATGHQRTTDAGWRHAETTLLALITLKPGEAFAAHANVGLARDKEARATATLFNLAAVWTPTEALLAFAETERNNKRDTFGGAVNRVGARWWLAPERFGVDLTASRQAGAGTGTTWGVGFGWYGIALF